MGQDMRLAPINKGLNAFYGGSEKNNLHEKTLLSNKKIFGKIQFGTKE